MSQQEPRQRVETFWRNVYLRGTLLFDPTGDVGGDAYGQPHSGLPRSRGFIIGPDNTVVLPILGHHPDRIMATIYELLDTMPPSGDHDDDGDVDALDAGFYFGCFTGPTNPAGQPCDVMDLDYDGDVDFTDFAILQRSFTGDS